MNIVEQIKEKLRNCDYPVAYVTVNKFHAKKYETELNKLGVKNVIFDCLIAKNKFYLT